MPVCFEVVHTRFVRSAAWSVVPPLALASPLSARAFVAPPGRATQMNAGAAVASGDVLLFLHADSRLPERAVPTVIEAMARTGRRWGCFDVTIAGTPRVLVLVAAMMNARSRLTGIATGDQGIFVQRALFATVGGYPDQPLMEDVALSRRLTGAAPIRHGSRRAIGPPPRRLA